MQIHTNDHRAGVTIPHLADELSERGLLATNFVATVIRLLLVLLAVDQPTNPSDLYLDSRQCERDYRTSNAETTAPAWVIAVNKVA